LRLEGEVHLEGAAIDEDLSGAGRDAHAGRSGLAAASADEISILSHNLGTK